MASILEQYESMYQSSNISENSSSNVVFNVTKNEGIINLRSDPMEPIFARNKIDFRPNHAITHMVVSNNQLLLSLENCQLLKIDLMNPSKPTEIDLNPHLVLKSTQKPFISDLFIDPSGAHCLITVGLRSDVKIGDDFTTYENFYYHRKLYILTKLKGHTTAAVTAVGWLLDPNNDKLCCNLLIGTSDGRVFETHFQPEDRFLQSRELSFVKPCCDLSISPTSLDQSNSSFLDSSTKAVSVTNKDSICGIHCFRLKKNHNDGLGLCVLIATKNFFYQYLARINQQSHQQLDGSPYLFQVFQNPSQKSYKEMPGIIDRTRLDLFYPIGVHYPKSFGWLTKPAIFYGEVPEDLDPAKDKRIFDEAKIIMYNDLHKTNKSLESSNNFVEEIPISLILTNFHLLLLFPSKLKIVCTLNQENIQEDSFLIEPAQGMAKDPIKNTIWAFTKRAVYRYKINQEDRNIWEIFLKKKDFQSAKKFAKNDLIKMDKTICEEALYHFSKKEYKKSAQLFTRTRSKSFEEIALKFIELHDKNQEALKEFLMSKLSTLSPIKERTQIVILLLWLFEIMLNQLALLQSSIQDSLANQSEVLNLKVEFNKIESSLKDLMSNANYKAANKKNRKIIYDLILNHHNSDIYEYFAQQIDDFECLIEHYCRRGEFDRALTLLRQEECLDLYYRYSPILIQHLPDHLINCLIPLSSELDFAKLIPSLVHFDHSNDVNNQSNNDDLRERQCKEILRFLEFCVYNLQTRNSLVHNYFLALLAQYQPDKLLTYLHDIGNGDDADVPYDLRYAARICMQNKVPTKAIVQLLTTMGAYEEAVEQSLSVNDVDMAKKTAEKIQTRLNDHHDGNQNQDLVKRLWLKIAKHVIGNIYSDDHNSQMNGNFDISMATSILKECSLLKIEDILPYFPEYLTIDHFKMAICQSLETYNHHIEELREDMSLATESAQQIREEIVKVRNRFTIIDSTDPCCLCSFPAIQEQFYSFPSCGHLFHHKCLIKEIIEYLPNEDRIKLETLISKSKSLQNQLHNMLITGHINNNARVNASNQVIEESSLSLTNSLENLNSQIEDLIGSECLLCGNLIIQTIDKPFIDPIRDREEMLGWS